MSQVISMAEYRKDIFDGETFLAIEDNETDLQLLKQIVESRGGIFLWATSLEDAESILKHIKVTVLTLDINLNSKNSGLSMLSLLRLKSGQQFTPKQIVIISEQIAEACEVGRVLALPKPIVPEQVLKHFEAAL
jgi:CheY-like chemotaxis protein